MVTRMRMAAMEVRKVIIFGMWLECRVNEIAVVNNMGCEREIPEMTPRF